MKKILLLLIASLFYTTSFSQSFYIDFGAKFMVGPSYLTNFDLMDNHDRYSFNYASFGYGGGFKLALDFTENVALVSEVIYSIQGQKYDMTDSTLAGGSIDYEKQLTYKSIQIPIMIRYNSEIMSYVEAGYVFSMLSEFTETLDGPNKDQGTSDISSHFSPKIGGLVLGFGRYIIGQDNFGVSAGLRFRYDLDDLLSNTETKYDNAPNYGLDSDVTSSTNPFSAMLVIEFNYDLGFYLAKAPCGKRRKLFIGH